jgi:hypothetical protein
MKYLTLSAILAVALFSGCGSADRAGSIAANETISSSEAGTADQAALERAPSSMNANAASNAVTFGPIT